MKANRKGVGSLIRVHSTPGLGPKALKISMRFSRNGRMISPRPGGRLADFRKVFSSNVSGQSLGLFDLPWSPLKIASTHWFNGGLGQGLGGNIYLRVEKSVSFPSVDRTSPLNP